MGILIHEQPLWQASERKKTKQTNKQTHKNPGANRVFEPLIPPRPPPPPPHMQLADIAQVQINFNPPNVRILGKWKHPLFPVISSHLFETSLPPKSAQRPHLSVTQLNCKFRDWFMCAPAFEGDVQAKNGTKSYAFLHFYWCLVSVCVLWGIVNQNSNCTWLDRHICFAFLHNWGSHA